MSDNFSSFKLPTEGELFTDQIITRSKGLIEAGIWQGLEPLQIDTWMSNFKNADEQYFAACVLDGLIYRSEQQTIAMMRELFDIVIPHVLQPMNVSPDPHKWFELLREEHNDPKIRIVPVIRLSDPPTKSGTVLARLYRRALGLCQDWMIWPWGVEDARKAGIETFLFIDDFLGTGQQFDSFARQFNLTTALDNALAVYAPLVAHENGLRFLQQNWPALKIASAETLTKENDLFAPSSPWFNDDVNTPDGAKEFYLQLVKRISLPLHRQDRFGYGKLSIAYAFDHATPDNSLPILWFPAPNWKPLLTR